MRVAVASGKGGTGKTFLSTHLAVFLKQRGAPDVLYADLDVEEPNGHLFLHAKKTAERRVRVEIPAVVPGRCTGCGRCQAACAFHAILAVPRAGANDVIVFPELCHACGACRYVCPASALTDGHREVGTVSFGVTEHGVQTVMGTLDVGEARATPLVEAVLAELPGRNIEILDAPPGTSCPAMAAVRTADRVVLVTEPTPFGLHDLALAVEMVRALGGSPLAVLNRADLGDAAPVREFLAAAAVPLVAEIPFSVAIAAAYASGEVQTAATPALEAALLALAAAVAGEGTR